MKIPVIFFYLMWYWKAYTCWLCNNTQVDKKIHNFKLQLENYYKDLCDFSEKEGFKTSLFPKKKQRKLCVPFFKNHKNKKKQGITWLNYMLAIIMGLAWQKI